MSMTRSLPMPKSARVLVWGAGTAILAAVAIAMQFTDEVNWDGADFLAAAGILIAVAAGLEGAFYLRRPTLRVAAVAAVLTGGALVWADAAVGILRSSSPLGGS